MSDEAAPDSADRMTGVERASGAKRAESSTRFVVQIMRLPHAIGLDLPRYESLSAAGADLRAALPEDQPLKLAPGARVLVPTGLVMALPQGHEAQVRPRSGLALRHGITVLNAPGTIDADFRGELQVLLINLGDAPFTIERGARIAQLVVQPVTYVSFEASEGPLGATPRGEGGFGSTGQQ